jgi:AcrR family transcriptional regulator
MPTSRRGRPRDSTLDARALEATRKLLEESGFESTTIQAVAERSGVHASAIYRRWRSRIQLIEEAIFPGFDPMSVQPTGDLRRDLRRFLRLYVATFSAPAMRAATPGLLAHNHSRSRQNTAEAQLRVSARPQFEAILRAAPAGSIDPQVDPDDVFDMLLGAVLIRTLVYPVTARHRPLERTVEMLLRMLQPLAALSFTKRESHPSRD